MLVNCEVLPKTNPHVKYQSYTMSSSRDMDLTKNLNQIVTFQNFNKVAQAENVGHSDLNASEP